MSHNPSSQQGNQPSEFLKNRDYQGLYQGYGKGDFPFTEFLPALKARARSKKHNLFKDNSYWESPAPFIYLAELLRSNFKADFYQGFFSQVECLNTQLLAEVFRLDNGFAEDYFKLYAFRNKSFREALWDASVEDGALCAFALQVKQISECLEAVEQRIEDLYGMLLEYPIDTVLFGFTVWVENFKYSHRALNDDVHKVRIIAHGVKMIERTLSQHTRTVASKTTDTAFLLQAEIADEWARYGHRRPFTESGYPLVLPPDPEYTRIKNVIYAIISLDHQKANIDRYIAGLSDAAGIATESLQFSPNENGRRYELNDKKNGLVQYYYSNLHDLANKIRSSKKVDLFSARVWSKGDVQYLQSCGFPSYIETRGSKVPLEDILRFLKAIAVFKGPESGNLRDHYGQILCEAENKTPPEMKKLLGGNEYISIYTYESFVRRVAKLLKWGQEKAKDIVGLLVLDLDFPPEKVCWPERPFLKYRGRLIWLGSFLRDRRWEYYLEHRLRKKSIGDVGHKTYSTAFEENIAMLFQGGGFRTILNHPLNDGGIEGEIDVLAYKSGFLFLLEAKNNSSTEEFSHTHYTELVRLEGLARHQLDKAAAYIHSNLDSVRELLEIPPGETVKIVPVVVSHSFQGDLLLLGGTYTKTTLLELSIIFRNDASRLYEAGGIKFHDLTYMNNTANPNVKRPNHDDSPEGYDLWEGQKDITPEIILDCLHTNRVWARIEEMWNL